jgi:hypothetical protein
LLNISGIKNFLIPFDFFDFFDFLMYQREFPPLANYLTWGVEGWKLMA